MVWQANLAKTIVLYCIVSVPSTWKFQAGAVEVALSLGLGISGVPISALSQIYSVLRAMF